MFAPKLNDSVSLLSPLVTVERAQLDEGDYFTSQTEISTCEEKTEIVVEEKTMRGEEVWLIPEIPPTQTIMDRDDDWFVLLDVVPRETSRAPPGTANIPRAASQLHQRNRPELCGRSYFEIPCTEDLYLLCLSCGCRAC